MLVWLLGIGMEGDLIAALPYALVAAVCMFQFLRPTVLVWFLLASVFTAATMLAAVSFHEPVNEFVIFTLTWGIPAVLLLWSWPRPAAAASNAVAKT